MWGGTMNYKLNWDELLCSERAKQRTKPEENDHRSDYENDYDRVVFSAPFRRLQDKAQVFPLERNDFVRTRLTHSIEVAAIARSIGISISEELLKTNRISQKQAEAIPVVLETAGLSHDIGNPPFGHYGEETIKNSFKSFFNEKNVFELTKQEKNDFLHFDGNCQMFRILTHLQCIKNEYGLNLCYATLATVMKYPFNSLDGNKDNEFCKENGIYYKKFGYFSSENEIANDVLRKTGLLDEEGKAYRHPLAFVLEAADDIAYSAADLEDGFKKGLISFKDLEETFCEEKCTEDCSKEACIKIREIRQRDSYYSDEKKLQDIRIILQGIMIHKVVDQFIDAYDQILNREFKDELLLSSKAGEIRTKLKDLSKDLILCNSEIQKTELGGEAVLEYLLKRFMKTVGSEEFVKYCLDYRNKKNRLSGNLDRMFNLISNDFQKVFFHQVDKVLNEEIDDNCKREKIFYYICLMVVDYISGMTDSYSTELCKKLQGIGNH